MTPRLSLAVWITPSVSGMQRICMWLQLWRARRSPRFRAWPSSLTVAWLQLDTRMVALDYGTWRLTPLWRWDVTSKIAIKIQFLAFLALSTKIQSFWCAVATMGKFPYGKSPRRKARMLIQCFLAPSILSLKWSLTIPRYLREEAIESLLKVDTARRRRRSYSLELRYSAFNSTLIQRTWPIWELRVAEPSREATVT